MIDNTEKYLEQIKNAIEQIDKMKWNATYHCNQISLAVKNNFLHKVVLNLFSDYYFKQFAKHLNTEIYEKSLTFDDIADDKHYVRDMWVGLIEKLLNFRAVCDYNAKFLLEKVNQNREYSSKQQEFVLKSIETFKNNTVVAVEKIIKEIFNAELITPKTGEVFDDKTMKENYVLNTVIEDIRNTQHGKALGKYVLNVLRPAVKDTESGKIVVKALADIDHVTLDEKYNRFKISHIKE